MDNISLDQIEERPGEAGAPADRASRQLADLLAAEPELRGRMALDSVASAMTQPNMSLRLIIATAMEGYADREAIAQRDSELVVDGKTGRRTLRLLPGYRSMTYAALWRRARQVAAFLRTLDGGGDDPRVAMFAHSSADYVAVDLACLEARVVSTPVQTGLTPAQLIEIVDTLQVSCIAVSPEFLSQAIDALDATKIPATLLVMDYEPEDDDQRAVVEAAASRVGPDRMVLMRDICASPVVPEAQGHGDVEGPDDRIATVFFTSGSTGSPKGAPYKERMLLRAWNPQRGIPSIDFHYYPLSHLSGRMGLLGLLASGGTAYFIRADLGALEEDLALIRPTLFGLVPRVAGLIYDRFRIEVERREAAGLSADDARRAALTHIRETYLGGRVLRSHIGAAPSSPEVRQFLQECFQVDLVDIYGSTEAGVVALSGVVQRPPVQSYKLIDVPELGYFTSDRPYPRGELLIKSQSMISGYFNNPAATQNIFDDEGFYKTGDIFEERGVDLLSYLDRRNNVLKLSQGEFVAVHRLETLFASSTTLIDQMYIYGNSQRSYLLAVVVPSEALRAEAARGDDGLQSCRMKIGEALRAIAADEALNSYEVPRDFIVELEPFSPANGLLTDTRKHRRKALEARYGARLEALYAQHMERQDAELDALRHDVQDKPVIETLARALSISLGIDAIDDVAGRSFGELGGDSLSAVSFSTLIEELFGVPIPVSMILSATATFAMIATQIEEALSGEGMPRPGFAEIHGAGARELRASDLTLERFLSPAILLGAPDLPDAEAGEPRCILLTGANGYLGRFLCLEWLERLAQQDSGKLICILRASDDAAALRRLKSAFGDADGEAAKRFETLARGRLEVLAGDIALPRLGLDPERWERLGEEVDLIVHPAALVNHILPYEQLFEPNVLGVAELISLALTRRKKRMAFVSSVAVCGFGGGVTETADVREASPTRRIDDGYGNGYANSKWAGEILAREAYEQFGVPVQVFRSDMILAHRTYRGQINMSDVFSRLLFSLAATGIAPRSFHEVPPPGETARPHYDGLPVDFTARAIVAIAGRGPVSGYETFHVVNANDDAISLDSFVDWMIADGARIQRLDDYDAWFDRFRTALQGLPDDARAASSIAVIEQLKRPSPNHPGSALSANRFEGRIAELGVDGGIPQLSRDYLLKCLDDLQANGLHWDR